MLRAFDGRRGGRPWRCAAADLYRIEYVHTPEPRLVGSLRPRHREQEPPRLHHHQAGPVPRWCQELVVGFPPRILPRHAHRPCRARRLRRAGRADRILGQQGPLPGEAAVRTRHAAQCQQTPCRDAQVRSALGSSNPVVRTSLPHASAGARSVRGRERVRGHPQALRPRQSSDSRLWLAVPAGP